VESEAAFGLLGGAARAAVPVLQKALADKAVIDLKPAASNAQRRIGTLIAEYQRNEDGIRISSEISSLRLADLVFDSTMIRVTAAAEGIINVTVTALPGL
jgi:integrase